MIQDLNNYLRVREEINQKGSVLIFNPIPKNKALEKKIIDNWIKISINKANEKKINGKDLTPFLLNEINILSKGDTLKANMELIISNAQIAGKIANYYYLKK